MTDQRLSASEIGAPLLDSEIQVLKGTTSTTLTKPSGKTTLTLKVTVGTFEIVNGAETLTYSGAPSTTTNGTGQLPVTTTDGFITFTSPEQVSLVGGSADDIVYYFWS